MGWPPIKAECFPSPETFLKHIDVQGAGTLWENKSRETDIPSSTAESLSQEDQLHRKTM